MHISKSIIGAMLFLLAFTYSCSTSDHDITKYGTIFKHVIGSDQGVFRGHYLGDSQSDVLGDESQKPIESELGYLYYEYKLDTLITYNITYVFNEIGLKEIQSEIYINKVEKVESVLNDFNMYFDNHYGPSESQMGFKVWSVKSENYKEIKISLNDESIDFSNEVSSGKISLWVYPSIN